MRRLWPLLVVGAMLLVPAARGDPALSSPGAGWGLAAWTFSNPANYTGVNATIADSAASLAWTVASAGDSTQADFAAALNRTNVNVSSPTGDVAIADTSIPGPVENLTWQPDPAVLADNFLDLENGGKLNWGTADHLDIGNWGGSAWGRGVLAFPALPLPANATLVSARLQLYFYNPIVTGSMSFSAHRMLDNWTESESTWNTRDGVTPWTTAGGDFDPTALDTSAAVGTTPGWFTWNITSLAIGWWTGATANDGLMVRQVGDASSTTGQKGFYSSDASNASVRPRLLLAYTLPGGGGRLESRLLDAGGHARWGRIFWNATVPGGTSAIVRTRSGNTSPVDASWSAWSVAVPAPGAPIGSPSSRYLQYSLDLTTSSSLSPAVHDVSVGYGRYASAARIETQDFDPTSLQGWGNLSLQATLPPGTSAGLAYSQDGGSSWLPAAAGANLSSALVGPIRLRFLLATGDTLVAPTLHAATLAYRIGGSPVLPPGGGSADTTTVTELLWIAGLSAIAVLGALLLALRIRRAKFRATELFLIHADGRLIARVGREEMQDEIAATAVFTLVLNFVRDSFRGPEGTGGELKSLEVDERDVSIARGRFLYLALVSEGPRPAALPARMFGFLGSLEAGCGAALEHWDGLRKGCEEVEAELNRFLREGYRKGHPAEDANYRS